MILYTYQKNIDLQAMSASESMKNDLGLETLNKLSRFVAWELEFDGEDETLQLKNLLENSFFIVNPNKELYKVNEMPTRTIRNGEMGIRVKVEQKISQQFDLETLNKNSGVKLKSLRNFLIWDLYVSYDEISSKEDVLKAVTRQVIITTNSSKGLLVNPVSERATISLINPTS
ncbi:hypothetical protein HOG98_09980 [bacterium]|jgi:hypothetical protein|nr:hypothetical protein [bacterium]